MADECLDSMEHYAYCNVVAEFAAQRLHLPSTHVRNMLAFLCLNREVDDETRVLQLLLLYAVYTASNHIRFARSATTIHSMQEFLLQYVHQGASQHSFAQNAVHRLVTAAWSTRRRIR